MYTKIEIEKGDEIERVDEDTKKEAEKERGDEIKNLGRAVNREGTEWGLGKGKICHHQKDKPCTHN